ncbi:MAG: hypothetical protein AVDCRST_MAG71-2301 [uncultured Lysobacter sp.]|uniref:Uncharacterized protein n=1 Tax=uncultured Lysobacter sp. TaxID=271060 RepID=A0A6J4LWI9_9GAMM|nr:MAG: hypothetical protein AVDCRST_MAG71-2301 [uncultured Lysobacter sp.]
MSLREAATVGAVLLRAACPACLKDPPRPLGCRPRPRALQAMPRAAPRSLPVPPGTYRARRGSIRRRSSRSAGASRGERDAGRIADAWRRHPADARRFQAWHACPHARLSVGHAETRADLPAPVAVELSVRHPGGAIWQPSRADIARLMPRCTLTFTCR